MISADIDMLVVGAGPTGLVLAAELARHGASLRIIDAASAPSQQSRAIGIQARTLELLQMMGLADEFTQRGLHVHAVNLYSGAKPIARLAFDGLESAFPYVLTLPQSETERILADHLERLGGRVERGIKLTGFAADADGVTATLEHADGEVETLRTRWLAGCDGAHSVVRNRLEQPFEGKTYQFDFVLADLQVDWALPNDEAHAFITDTGLLAIFPLPGNRHRVIIDVSMTDPPEANFEAFQALVAARAPIALALHDPQWVSAFRIHARMVARLQAGRVFLLGDAAHIHSPALAQGMNTGIQDAVNLAWKVGLTARGIADPGLLDSYEAERRPVEHGVLQQTDLMTRLVSLEAPLARGLRDRLMSALLSFDVVRQRARRTVSELAVHYRQSPIVEEHWQAQGPPAGDRVPEMALTAWDGSRETTLLEALRQARHVLLLALDARVPKALQQSFDMIAKQVQDSLGDLIHVYRPSADVGDWPAICLIRPDGYVGFRGSSAHVPELSQFLDRMLPGRRGVASP
jgi:2-polyprenyl-6-methoxyphenol hydroxylase-like FAD-dependent oxidoreductase